MTVENGPFEELVWEDPPPNPYGVRGRSWIDRAIGLLRDRPGEWAIVARYQLQGSATTTADKLKRSGTEATTRASDGGYLIYARWPEDAS